jgi:transketolase
MKDYMAEKIQSLPEFNLADSKERCRKIRRRILEISQLHGAIHIGGAFSCLEMVDVIHHGFMRRTHEGDFHDSFILSKGHGCMVLFVILEQLGILPSEDIEKYCTAGGRLGMHPDRGTPGIITSTGSLGHGLGMGAGLALYEKVSKGDRDIYVVMSDGELQEGSVWEIFLQAPALKLNHLIGIVDYNNMQSMDFTTNTHPNFYPIVEKAIAFGWEAVEVDAHNQEAIFKAITSRSRKKPFLLVGKSVKGKGVSYMENKPIWHYRSPNKDEFKQAMEELSD